MKKVFLMMVAVIACISYSCSGNRENQVSEQNSADTRWSETKALE